MVWLREHFFWIVVGILAIWTHTKMHRGHSRHGSGTGHDEHSSGCCGMTDDQNKTRG